MKRGSRHFLENVTPHVVLEPPYLGRFHFPFPAFYCDNLGRPCRATHPQPRKRRHQQLQLRMRKTTSTIWMIWMVSVSPKVLLLNLDSVLTIDALSSCCGLYRCAGRVQPAFRLCFDSEANFVFGDRGRCNGYCSSFDDDSSSQGHVIHIGWNSSTSTRRDCRCRRRCWTRRHALGRFRKGAGTRHASIDEGARW